MKLSLPILMVACLIGYAASLTTETSEIVTKVICEETETTKMSDDQMTKLKIQKLQGCLNSKRNQLGKQQKNSRQVRSADKDDSLNFGDLFKSTAAFKRMLSQYMKLKESVIEKTNELEHDINKAVLDFANDKSGEKLLQKDDDVKSNVLKCEKPKTVINIKQALLTSKNTEQMCTKTVKLNLDNMDEVCNDKIEATMRLAHVCNGMNECEISVKRDMSGICDCAESKYLSIEFTCEADKEPSHTIKKRAMYYQNDAVSKLQNDILNQRVLSLYDYDYYPINVRTTRRRNPTHRRTTRRQPTRRQTTGRVRNGQATATARRPTGARRRL